MTKETLKKLIEIEYDRSETISQFKQCVFRLIDLYHIDYTDNISDAFKAMNVERKEYNFVVFHGPSIG